MLQKTKFYLLVLSDYQTLGSKVTEIIGKHESYNNQLSVFKNRITPHLKNLGSYRNSLKSALMADEISRIDKDVNDAWRCLNHHIMACTVRLNNDYRTNASMLLSVVNKVNTKELTTGKNIHHDTLNTFISSIDNNIMLKDALYAIGAGDLFNELRNAYSELLRRNETILTANNLSLEIKSSAMSIKDTITDMCRYINNITRNSEDTEAINIARELDTVIEDINAHALYRTSRRQNIEDKIDLVVSH
ncbi:MAG: hypothetical protein N4A72_20665 [Bacteroidales bacterium]|jgi:hypothetical protein|nr:hypothetical protein [Bacteroidales bacterium]